MNDIKQVFSIRKPERNKKIFVLYQEGMTFAKIGKRFRITKQRASQICKGIQSTLDKEK